MTLPWKRLDRVSTPEGVLELRQRGPRDFLITVGGRVLMNSTAQRSEIALGQMACRLLQRHPQPGVLMGGLGMGFTLRAVLDLLPAAGRVLVAELNPVVLAWCRGPLAVLTDSAVDDPRVTVEIADAADLIRTAAERQAALDAVILDLYTGPYAHAHGRDDPLYGTRAIARARTALKPGGFFAVWGENLDPGFESRLRAAGLAVAIARPGRGGFRHVVYLAQKEALPDGPHQKPAGPPG
jgi:spermidine synthase